MPEIREGRVEAIGAAIHYKVSGRGPVLLVLPDGDGNADASDRLAAELDGFTVVTYDRRGTPRSPIDDPREPVTLATHADDAARVLIAVCTHAARAVGFGAGAAIGLELVARHPHRVSMLVAVDARPLPEAELALASRLGVPVPLIDTDAATTPRALADELGAVLRQLRAADGTG